MGAVAWPQWRNIRREHNEAYALGSMRTITFAHVYYRSVTRVFACALATLGKPCPGTPVAPLSQQLAKNGAELDGYIFVAAPSGDAVRGTPDCNGIPTSTGYYATARPV